MSKKVVRYFKGTPTAKPDIAGPVKYLAAFERLTNRPFTITTRNTVPAQSDAMHSHIQVLIVAGASEIIPSRPRYEILGFSLANVLTMTSPLLAHYLWQYA